MPRGSRPRHDPHSQNLLTRISHATCRRAAPLVLGYEDLNDHDELRADPLLATVHERRGSDATSVGRPPGNCVDPRAPELASDFGGDVLVEIEAQLAQRTIPRPCANRSRSHSSAERALERISSSISDLWR